MGSGNSQQTPEIILKTAIESWAPFEFRNRPGVPPALEHVAANGFFLQCFTIIIGFMCFFPGKGHHRFQHGLAFVGGLTWWSL